MKSEQKNLLGRDKRNTARREASRRQGSYRPLVAAFFFFGCLVSASPSWGQEAGPAFARPHRLAFSLGFGLGSAALSDVHDVLDTAVQGGEAPTSSLQVNAEFSARYYFPYHVLAQVGYGALYNWASETYSVGALSAEFSNYNVIMEIPFLAGGHYAFKDRFQVYGALGPSVFLYPRVFLDPGADIKADPGVGFQVLAGVDFFAAEHFALALEVRYRYLKTGDLLWIDNTQTPSGAVVPAGEALTEGQLFGNGSDDRYSLDMSGVSVGLNLRFFAI